MSKTTMEEEIMFAAKRLIEVLKQKPVHILFKENNKIDESLQKLSRIFLKREKIQVAKLTTGKTISQEVPTRICKNVSSLRV